MFRRSTPFTSTAAFCRAKSLVLQYALCNPWDYFFTGTLDETKLNRHDLDAYRQKLSQFIRDKRKEYGTQVQYLLIPEQHKDGAWHIHGMLANLPGPALRRFRRPEPWKLVNSEYLNWPDYQRKFGFCSLGPIKHPVATSFYITKYVSKELSRRGGDLGKHLYFHSRPLKRRSTPPACISIIPAWRPCASMTTTSARRAWCRVHPGTSRTSGTGRKR